MKASILAVAGLGASLVAATPLNKRAWATTYDIVTVTVTVTGFPPTETAAAETAASTVQATEAASSADVTSWAAPSSAYGSGGGWWGAWRGWGSGSAVATAWGSQSAAATTTLEAQSTAAPTWETQTAAATTIETSAPAPTETYSALPTSTVAASSSSVAVVESSASWSASPTSSTAASSTAAPASTSISSDYQQGILDSHNIHRRNATVSDLVWSDDMASIAAQIAASCVYAHDTSAGGGGYGQNIGAGAAPSAIPAMITDEMYNDEINFYPAYGVEPDMSNFEKWGHYSQIVWKSTTAVGCATQYCPNGLANTGSGVTPYFTVCNYSPPGNFGGEYAANVLQPIGLPSVTL